MWSLSRLCAHSVGRWAWWGAAIATVVGIAGAHAGQAQPTAVLVLDTNAPDAWVYADTLLLGRAQDQPFRWPIGQGRVRLQQEGGALWAASPLEQDVTTTLVPGDTLRIRLHWPYHYRLESLPFGARLSLVADTDTVALGQTPFTYTASAVPAGVFRLEADGYEPLEVPPGTNLWNHGVYALTPLEAEVPAASWTRPPRARRWLDVAAGALIVVGGGLAVHNKLKADRRYDTYLATGDRGLRRDVRRFDTRAAVALGGMQVGVGVLALRLVLR